MDRFIIISGCSGGGKSTLLEELRRRGYATVEEPGRRIVAEELANGGRALPWVDLAAFAWRAIEVSLADIHAAKQLDGPVFFDRGLLDATAALEQVYGERSKLGLPRFNRNVFLTPPWPEIYVNDSERRHDMKAAVEEYDRLLSFYPSLDYETVLLPKVSVEERVDFVQSYLGLKPRQS
ncbi:putative ATPase [Pseudorhizobium tarimense]|uniref:ATPase n=1 Tax=Pseudorhizobium tarimense TaxID=1079109 RepID=A0ABV2HBC4_9HYPH|nr:AAA family ATPase [Pseudorhizobium tarimense]MCJ8520759.1 AAA family ATPase [Pseudorhizobium tarimense]